MTLSTTSCAVHITPTVFKTFLAHYSRAQRRRRKQGRRVATDEVLFDEAFHVVKRFILLGTHNTVEDLQQFTNTHVPSPYWSTVAPVTIPLHSCNTAADVLIGWFDPSELKNVVGGERWWQVRGLDGIDGEWITEKEFLSQGSERMAQEKQRRTKARLPDMTEVESDILNMEHLERVMFYIHGGAFFWGSINTHRYQIQRYVRQTGGRAFAVNYRKAPQYPWPCPLQDVLAAYLYLIQPPPTALHAPVPPSKIVIAGDSAGASLGVSLLVVLRDMGLPLPAGAVFISPWVDLTHSFPSIMDNMESDIIPPHGFIHKPSSVWPVASIPPRDPNDKGGRARVVTATTNPPPEPGQADTLRPSSERMKQEKRGEVEREEKSMQEFIGNQQRIQIPSKDVAGEGVKEIDHALGHESRDARTDPETPPPNGDSRTPSGQISDGSGTLNVGQGISDDDADRDKDRPIQDPNMWEPKPPKVLMNDRNATPLELRSQIQLYAENEQLVHPLVSPVLQSSLGNLCPLYIIAGDKELLRDEVMYIAHKAAHPGDYPVRSDVTRDSPRQRENAKKFTQPTKVHLQVFDDMCHVLTVFTFTPAANYAYRAIAQFVRHVTDHPVEYLEHHPFPEVHPRQTNMSRRMREKTASPHHEGHQVALEQSALNAQQEIEDELEAIHALPGMKADILKAAQERGVPDVLMVRERVNIYGFLRVMEPVSSIPALHIPPSEIGLIKEAPVRRWQAGQDEWDRLFKKVARRVVKTRRQLEARTDEMIATARQNGFRHEIDTESLQQMHSGRSHASTLQPARGEVQSDRRWGPLDLDDENPPSSAIAKRRDTPDALALIQKTLYYTAPVTHRRLPTWSQKQIFKTLLRPKDQSPFHPPKQSVSEQQAAPVVVHGMQMWSTLMSYLVRFTSHKATKKFAIASDAFGDQLGRNSSPDPTP